MNITVIGDKNQYESRISAVYTAEFDSEFKILVCHVNQDPVLPAFESLVQSIKNGLKASKYLKQAIKDSANVTLKIEYIQEGNTLLSPMALNEDLLKKKYDIINTLKSYAPYGLNDLNYVFRYDFSLESVLAGKLMKILKRQGENLFTSPLKSDRERPVYQYSSEDGSFVASYNSIAEAANTVNVTVSAIHHCCTGRGRTSGGYVWSFDKYDNIGKIRRLPDKRKKVIYQYDKETGELLADFTSIAEASYSLNIPQSNISACCNGRLGSAGGYMWSYTKSSNIDTVTTDEKIKALEKRINFEATLTERQRKFIEDCGQDYNKLVKQANQNN